MCIFYHSFTGLVQISDLIDPKMSENQMYIRILRSNESEPQEMVLCRALHLHSRCSARLKQLTTDKQLIRRRAFFRTSAGDGSSLR